MNTTPNSRELTSGGLSHLALSGVSCTVCTSTSLLMVLLWLASKSNGDVMSTGDMLQTRKVVDQVEQHRRWGRKRYRWRNSWTACIALMRFVRSFNLVRRKFWRRFE